MNSATLTPADGRSYRSRAAALADWEAGKDFVIHTLTSETRCSKRDARRLLDQGFTHLTFRNANGNILVNLPIKA